MYRKIFTGVACLCLCLSFTRASERPNIVFIFADDMSYEAIKAHGLLDIDTPHLDSLVERGTSFTHA